MTESPFLSEKNFYARLKKRTVTSLAIIVFVSLATLGYLITVRNILFAVLVLAVSVILVVVNLVYSHWNLIRKLKKMGLTDAEIEKYKLGILMLPTDN